MREVYAMSIDMAYDFIRDKGEIHHCLDSSLILCFSKYPSYFRKNIFMRLICLLFVMLVGLNSFAQNKDQYDSVLAKKTGADANGMKRYVICILKTGPVNVTDSVKRAELFAGHMKNINRLADEGKLVVAGPLVKDPPFRGIFIFNVATIEEAKALTATDPAVAAGIFDVEFHPWYASAALVEVNNIHKKIQKKNP